MKKFLIFSQKKLFDFQEKKLYIFLKIFFLIFRERCIQNSNIVASGTFLIFQERHIQNPDITELSYISGNGAG